MHFTQPIGIVCFGAPSPSMQKSDMDVPFRDLDGPDAEDEGAGREVKDGAEEGEQQVLKGEFLLVVPIRPYLTRCRLLLACLRLEMADPF